MSNPTARALLFDGESGRLRLEEREKPAPGPGEPLATAMPTSIAKSCCGATLTVKS